MKIYLKSGNIIKVRKRDCDNLINLLVNLSEEDRKETRIKILNDKGIPYAFFNAYDVEAVR